MATSVGSIYLDLVIKNKINDQITKLKQSIENSFSTPMKQAAESVEKAVESAGENGAKAMKESFKSASESMKSDIQRLAKEAAKVKVSAPQSSMAESVPLGKSKTASEMGIKSAEEIAKAEALKAERAEAERLKQAMEALGNYEISDEPIERIRQKLELTVEKADLLQKKWQELMATDDGSEEMRAKLNAVETQLVSVSEQVEKTQNEYNEALNNLPTGVFSELVEGAKTAFKKIGTSAVDTFRAIPPKIKSFGNKAFSSFKKAGSSAINHVKSKLTGLYKTTNDLEKPMLKFANSIKNAAKRIFLMAGVLSILKAIRSALSESVGRNEEFARSLNEIKANLNIAFVPIINAVMPAINTLMSGLAALTKQFAAFTSELFGSTYKKSLETIKQLKKAGEEAKKSSTYLASFDEMSVASDSSANDSSGSEKEGTDYSAIDGNAKLTDWAEKMKEAIKSGDWAGVGKLLADKVNGAFGKINWDFVKKKVEKGVTNVAKCLNSFVKNVKWKTIGKDLGNSFTTILLGVNTFLKKFDWTTLGQSVADLFNGAIETTDFSLIGETLASKINAAIDTLDGFVSTFNFSGFGAGLANSVNAFFKETDFKQAAETFSGSIKGILDTGISFLQTVNWSQVGQSIVDFLSNIDWAGIAKRAFELLGSALGASVTVVVKTIKELGKGIADNFKDGFFNGIKKTFSQIGNWIKTNIFEPFIDGFKKCFDIHSPSRVMDEQGSFIMEGLLQGIKNKIAAVKQKFTDIKKSIKTTFKSIPEWLKNKFSDALSKVKEAFSLSAVKTHFEAIKTKIVDIFDGLKDALKAPLNGVIDIINNLIDKLNEFSIDLPDWAQDLTGFSSFGFDIPEIPKLATGGLAKAPTLAMVGDNRNASVDPEVIAPLSKLKDMLGGSAELNEIAELLREILQLLRTIDLTVIAQVDKKVLFESIRQLSDEYRRRTGASAF